MMLFAASSDNSFGGEILISVTGILNFNAVVYLKLWYASGVPNC